jgi:hypothetical protein
MIWKGANMDKYIMRFLLVLLLSFIVTIGLFAEFVIVNSADVRGITANVVESQSDYTIVEIILENYVKNTVTFENEEYVFLTIPSGSMRLEKGNPDLPILARDLQIPPQSRMNFEILDQTYSEIRGRVLPSKGSLSRQVNPADIPFEFSKVYQTDAFFPESVVELSDPYIMREIRGITFRVSPFTVNPVQGIIRVHESITIKIYADGIDTIDTMSHRSSRITSDFVSVYQSHFMNFDILSTRYSVLVETGHILVISHPAFMDAMQPYVDWKNQKGIPTTMVSTAVSGTTVANIKNYIRTQFNANPNLAFIQLVGDSPQIPSLNIQGPMGDWGSSDVDYVLLVGSSFYPDLFIGRFSAETVAQVQTQVHRTIWYERDIGTDATWLTRAFGIASNEGPGWGGGTHPGGAQADHRHMEVIRLLLLANGYTLVDQLYETPNNITTIANTNARLSAAINEGRGFGNFVGHGLQNGWQLQKNPSVFFSNFNAGQLTNDWMLPHIVSVACLPGQFTWASGPCFAEVLMRATNVSTGAPRGAIATYKATVEQPWVEPMAAQDHIVELLVAGTMKTIGGLYFNGANRMLSHHNNSAARGTMRTWTIFGDAALMVRSKVPTTMTVTAQDSILVNQSNYLVATNVAGALASLYRPDTREIVGSGITNTNGQVTITFNKPITQPCVLTLTVTAFNAVTHVRNVNVTSPPEPPPPPTNLVATVNGRTVSLTWSPPTSGTNLQGYNVYRGNTLLSSNIKGQAFEATNTPIGINNFRVTAVYSDGESRAVETLVHVGFSPTNLISTGGVGIVDLMWTAPAILGTVTFSGYRVERSEAILNDGQWVAGNEGFSRIAENILLTNYTDDNITIGTTYLYRIIAHYTSPAHTSQPSNITTSTPYAILPPEDLTYRFNDFSIILSWSAPATITSAFIGYRVYRGTDALTDDPIQVLTYTDLSISYGTFTYSVIAIYTGGDSEPATINFINESDIINPILTTALYGNYPNPFNPETVIYFALSTDSSVNLDIYNIRGQRIRSLVSGYLRAGEHQVVWNGLDDAGHTMSSGIYLYVLRVDDYMAVRRMLLLK